VKELVGAKALADTANAAKRAATFMMILLLLLDTELRLYNEPVMDWQRTKRVNDTVEGRTEEVMIQDDGRC